MVLVLVGVGDERVRGGCALRGSVLMLVVLVERGKRVW
jgi:hypothetical protein